MNSSMNNNSMKKMQVLSVAVAVALTSVAAFAQVKQATPDNAKPRMQQLDVNKDGMIDRSEASKAPKLAKRFEQMDVNKDGYLDKADRQARQAQRRTESFNAADTNHDGVLSRAEFDAFKPDRRGMRHGSGHGKGHGMNSGMGHGMSDAKAHTPKP